MISRWPSSKTKRAPQKVHPLPQRLQNSRVFTPPPVKLLRAVHPPVTQLRAIDLEPVLLRAERDAPKPTSAEPAAVAAKHEWAAGQWAKCVTNVSPVLVGRHGLDPVMPLTIGKLYEVVQLTHYSKPMFRCDDGVVSAFADEMFTPVAAPVAAPQPAGARFVVGALVRLTFAIDTTHCARRQKGREVVVHKTADYHGNLWVRDGRAGVGEYKDICVHWRDVGPLPSETPERGDWTPEACGWVRDERVSGRTTYKLGESSVWLNSGDGLWRWVVPGNGYADVRDAKPLAQACCAALGIRIDSVCDGGGVCAQFEGKPLGEIHGDDESCARLALAAHARLVSR